MPCVQFYSHDACRGDTKMPLDGTDEGDFGRRLPLTDAVRKAVAKHQPAMVRLGGWVELHEATRQGFIALPGSARYAADGIFWSEHSGVHLDLVMRNGLSGRSVWMSVDELLKTVVAGCQEEADERAKRLRRAGVDGLPEWLKR
jgi:hypothetical protein